MKKVDTVYLRHILDAVTQIEEYLRGIAREEFLNNHLLQDGVVRELEIIGEASRNLTDEFREKFSHVPWSQIISLRNRITHAYFDVNLDIVWEITQNDLPSLKREVERLLP